MRARLLAVLLGTVGVIALTGCAASVPEPAPTSAIDNEAVDQHTTDEESADAPATTTIPAGARAASADFAGSSRPAERRPRGRSGLRNAVKARLDAGRIRGGG